MHRSGRARKCRRLRRPAALRADGRRDRRERRRRRLVDDTGDPSATRTYVVSTIDTRVQGDESFGFDLDGMIGGNPDRACTNASDYVSAVTSEPGVLLPLLEDMVDGSVDAAIHAQNQSGSLLLVIDLGGIDDFQNDADVEVHVALATVAGGASPVIDRDGLAVDQSFIEMMSLGTGFGAITNGHLRAAVNTLPLSFDLDGSSVTLTQRDSSSAATSAGPAA